MKQLGKFKVGDYWMTRSGGIEKITHISDFEDDLFPIETSNFCLYKHGGYSLTKTSPHDLVRKVKVTFEKDDLQLEVGKLYRLENGEKAFCLYRTGDIFFMAIPNKTEWSAFHKCGKGITERINVASEWSSEDE